MNTQIYDKVEEYKTLEYLENHLKYKHYELKEAEYYYKVFFDFDTHKLYLNRIHLNVHTNHICLGMK